MFDGEKVPERREKINGEKINKNEISRESSN
jgi:hypothetical protein